MFSRIHQKLGTAGFVIAIVALVAALGGTAWAVSGLNGKQKKEVKKIAKQFAGKDGKDGLNGANGAQGVPGASGADGLPGAPGADGVDGEDGKSVVTGSATVEECADGGATVQVEGEPATKKAVCNGADGEDGETGFTETLPSGKTETGTWAFGRIATAVAQWVPISFSIPLPASFDSSHVHYVKTNGKEKIFNEALPPETPGFPFEEPTSTACTGTVEEPKAAAGHLCIYEKSLSGTEQPVSNLSIFKAGGAGQGAATTGAYIETAPSGTNARGVGTFAVTAP